MRLSKYVPLGIASLSLGTGLAVSGTTAHALQNEWKNDHWVTITRTVYVDKYKITNPMYKSYVVKTYTIKRGAHYKLSHWGVNFPWALQSGKYNSGSHYTFVPDESYNDASWFKAGIHSLKTPNRYTFHGYRISKSNAITSYNTWYQGITHTTISYYKPINKSKVIFKRGTKEIPTKHCWAYAPKNSNKIIDYFYDSKHGWYKALGQ